MLKTNTGAEIISDGGKRSKGVAYSQKVFSLLRPALLCVRGGSDHCTGYRFALGLIEKP